MRKVRRLIKAVLFSIYVLLKIALVPLLLFYLIAFDKSVEVYELFIIVFAISFYALVLEC